MNVKLQRKDLLTPEELDKFKELGGDAEAEVEVALSDYIKTLVSRAISEAFAAKEKEAIEQAEAEAAYAEAKAVEDAKRLEEEAVAAEVAKQEEEAKEIEAAIAEYKAIVESLKSAIAESK